jgi:hypothetical protein
VKRRCRFSAFMSYQMEDYVFRREFASSISQLERGAIFLDHPKKESFDPGWKDWCTELIRSCTGTVVLIGSTTFQSEPVAWEIEETRRQGLPLLGVRLPDCHPDAMPTGLAYSATLPLSDRHTITSRIRAWSEEPKA